MSGAGAADAAAERSCCPVVELRQYTTRPGCRDELIALFDRNFVESQEELGISVLGQFRDRCRADRFVWLRGFSGMRSRHTALQRFYGGPVWAAHKDAANSTMLDSDDVLLLRPARPDLALRLDPRDRPAAGEERTGALVLAGIHHLPEPSDAAVATLLDRQLLPGLRAHGARIDGVFVTEPAPNTFARLPVREGENVLVWFGAPDGLGMPPAAAPRGAAAAPGWLARLAGDMISPAGRPPVLLELEPTPRSLLGHHRARR
jgi:hypothetical protein